AAMRSNLTMARLFKQNMEAVGHPIRLGDNTLQTFSTDVGNVSSLVPAIQPLVSIAPDDIHLHTTGFAKVAATEEALGCMLDAARAMAMTAVDILADPDTAVKVREEFRKSGYIEAINSLRV
ncbi:MAG: hypothetical protein MUO19_06215, partial [Dehalococcoidales bacterium]|nr:hypothetical protein [Dehalococcoidales bacterium]